MERRRTPTTPPGDVAAAFATYLAALNTDIPTHQPQYDSGIDAALDGIWSDAGNALSDANSELSLSGSNWTNFTATVPTAVLTDVASFQGNTGGYLGGMKTDVQSMMASVSLPGVTLPTNFDWSNAGGIWTFSGVDESTSPFVGPPGGPSGNDYKLNRVNGNVTHDNNGNLVINGRFENRDQKTSNTGDLIQETYALVEAGMIQMPGVAGGLQGVRIDYIKNDYPTVTSALNQRLIFEGDPTNPSDGHVQATIAVLDDNKAIGATFDKPAFGQPGIGGYISFTGADHTIQLSAAHNPSDPSQDFARGLFSMNKESGPSQYILSTAFESQNHQKSLTTQLMVQQPDTLLKIQAQTSDAFNNPMYHDWNLSGSAIHRFGASPLDLFTQIGYQKSRSGMSDFYSTDTSFGIPNYRLSWRNQGFIVIPDPSIEGGYARIYAAIPLPKSMLPPQSPNAFGYGRRLVLGATSPFNHPIHGLTYFFGVIQSW